MNQILNFCKRIFRLMIASENNKYNILVYAITTIHILLVGLFCYLHIFPMILFNIGSVIIYSACIIDLKHDRHLLRIFLTIYVEIVVHSIVSTICIGWRFGFPQYIIALIPFGFYMCHSLIDSSKKYILASLLGIGAFFVYIGCRTLSMFFGPIYDVNASPILELSIYCFNSICTYCFMLIFSLIFVYEMQWATNKLRNQNSILEKLANTDPLTGLYNRRSMQIFLNHALESKSDFYILMCDIDNFKKLNDSYGHDFGDEVLKSISSTIKTQVSDNDYVCRWGGEEILILISADFHQALQTAENIRRNIANSIFYYEEKIVHCSVTIGAALHKKNDSIEATITQADNNLYYGKRNGKNRVVS